MKPIPIYYILLLVGLLTGLTQSTVFSQTPEASYSVSSDGRVNLRDYHVDPVSKDMYLYGELDNSITFNGWGAGKTQLGDDPGTKDFFYAHYKAGTNGMSTLLRFSVSGEEAYISKIAVSSQYAYVIGSFTDKLTVYDHNGNLITTDSGVSTFTSAGNTDVFLAKIDKNTGALKNVFTIGGTGRDFGDFVTIDREDNLMVAGRFDGAVSFAINNIISFPVTSDGNDLFVARYNAGDTFLNLAVFGGPQNQDKIVGLATDAGNNLYVAGRFNQEVTIDTKKVSFPQNNQIFIARLDTDLDSDWIKHYGRDKTDAFPVENFTYHDETKQVIILGKISETPVYDGASLVSRDLSDDLYLLKIAGNTGNLAKSIFLRSSDYVDGKRIAFDQRGNFFLNGTFRNEFPLTSGGLTKQTTGSGSRSTFLGVFNMNNEPTKDDGIIYLSDFSSSNEVFASQGMTLFEQGNQLDMYIPLVHDLDLNGLDGNLLSKNASGRYNIFIGKYQFPSIPSVSSTYLSANEASDPFYIYEVYGDNIGDDVTVRLRDTDNETIAIDDSFSDDDESLLFGLPTSLVAGKKYRVELDKGPYRNFFAFEEFSIPPAVFELEDKDGTCEETLTVPGRYFGTVAGDVQVVLYRGETEAGTATVLAATGDGLQIKFPPIYADTYQLRVRVNGVEGVGGEVTVLPDISQITPASVEPGKTIVAEGCAFVVNESTPLPTVTLQNEGGTSISVNPTINVNEPRRLNVPLPSDLSPGTYTLNVTVNGSLATGTTTFTVIDPGSTLPAIQSLSAITAKPGTELTIQGKNLGAVAGETIFVRIEGRDPVQATANEDGTVISFTLPNDIPAAEYTLTVVVGDQEAVGEVTLTVSPDNVPDPLGTPAVVATALTDSSFVLSWDAIIGADSYRVEANTDANFGLATAILDVIVSDTTATVSDLLPETRYHFRVRSQDKSGRESGTNAQDIITPAEGVVVTDPELVVDIDNPIAYFPNASESLAVTAIGLLNDDQLRFVAEGLRGEAMDDSIIPVTDGQATVALSAITAQNDPLGFEYHYEVRRGGGTAATTETKRVYRQYVEIPLALPSKDKPTQEDYRIVALPFQEQTVTQGLQGVTASDKKDIRLLRYDPASGEEGTATTYEDYTQQSFGFEPGRGYWLLKRNGIDLEVQGTATEIDENYSFSMPLQPGWNLVGNPFPFPIEASLLGDGTKQVYRNGTFSDATDQVSAYEGILVSSDDQKTLTFSARTNGRTSTTPEGISQYADRPIDSDRWYVPLAVSNGYLTNSLIGVGMHRQAKDALDRFDVLPLPRFSRFVEAQFINSEVRYALGRDIVAPAAQHRWQFDIVTDQVSDEISIAWDNTLWGTNDRQLLLLDIEAQQLIDMREVTNYTFRVTPSGRSFELFYGSEDALSEKLLPHRVQVGAAYPNPTTQQVFVPISIPPGQAVDVRVQIVDMTGRTVQRLQQSFGTGFHTLSWERHDEQQQPLPDGLYFYQVTVGVEQFAGKFMYQTE